MQQLQQIDPGLLHSITQLRYNTILSLPLQPPKQCSIIALPQILLPNPAISLKQNPSCEPLHNRKSPPRRISGQPIPPHHIPQLPCVNTSCPLSIKFRKDFIERRSVEMTLQVIDSSIGSMLCFVDAVYIDAEERVGEVAVSEASGV